MQSSNLQPPYYGGFLFMGAKMHLIDQIEHYRKEKNLPVFYICNILAITDTEYFHMISYHIRPTTYQLIMFIASENVALKNI